MAGCTRLIEVDLLVFDGNVRSPACMQLPQMVTSIKRHGWKPNHPLVLSEKVDRDGKITGYLVLIGNRRGLGLQFLRDKELTEYQRVLPGGKVPAIVHRGLTLEEEVDLRIDHSSDEDRVPLDDWSVFLAVKQLVQVGIDTQERIAEKLGLYVSRGKKKGQPNRPFVQTRVHLARLPQYVQDEFEKLMIEGKDTTNVRFADIATLSKTFNAEFIDHPDGSGPEFQKVWKKALEPRVKPQAGEADAAKELSPAEAIRRSQGASSRGLRDALLVVTHQSKANLAEIDTKILNGESAISTLAEIKDYLGEKDYAELLDSSRKQAIEKAAPDVTVDEPHEHVEA